MKHLKLALLALLFFVQLQKTSAYDATIIRNDPGGMIGDFIQRYKALDLSRSRVVIDGYCNSACTLITHYVPADRVCVTKTAILGFHSAFNPKDNSFAKEATWSMWSIYPERVRRLIRRGGWDGKTEHPDLVEIPGTKIYKRCP